MASHSTSTVETRLTIASNTATSDNINITISDTLTTTEPVAGISRVKCETAGSVIIDKSVAAITYVYAKNCDPVNIIVLGDGSGNSFMDLSPGEYAMFPLKGSKGLTATAITAASVLEYSFFTKK